MLRRTDSLYIYLIFELLLLLLLQQSVYFYIFVIVGVCESFYKRANMYYRIYLFTCKKYGTRASTTRSCKIFFLFLTRIARDYLRPLSHSSALRRRLSVMLGIMELVFLSLAWKFLLCWSSHSVFHVYVYVCMLYFTKYVYVSILYVSKT